MADHCNFCDTRRPVGGTNILILNDGEFWAEFCPWCGDREWLHNPETDEWITVGNLFRRNAGEEPVEPKSECPENEQRRLRERMESYHRPAPLPKMGELFPATEGG